MKKSKIIVPALGLLLLSTAASVSGTVAWFTASTTAEANINSFAVKKIDGRLSAVMQPGVGTKKSGDAIVLNAQTTGTTNAGICDASFDYATKNLFTKNPNATASNRDTTCKLLGAEPGYSYSSGDTATASTNFDSWFAYADQVSDPKVDVWYAVSWDIAFEYEAGAASTGTLGLYFDPTSTASAVDQTGASGTELSGNGFRVAFYSGAVSSSVAFVWAPLQTEANCFRITGSDGNTAKTAYTDAYLIASDYSTNNSETILLADATAANTSAVNYIADFTGTTTKTLTVHCVAWFEGTDPGIVDTAKLQTVSSVMKFFTKVA